MTTACTNPLLRGCQSARTYQLGALTAALLGGAAQQLGAHCSEAGAALQAPCTAASAVVGCVDLSKVTRSTPTGKFKAMSPSCRCLEMAT